MRGGRLRALAQLQQLAQGMCHGQHRCVRLVPQRVEDLIELVLRPNSQVEEQDLPAIKLAAATAIAAGKRLGSKGAEKLAYATSYDKRPGDSFVGYVGVLF